MNPEAIKLSVIEKIINLQDYAIVSKIDKMLTRQSSETKHGSSSVNTKLSESDIIQRALEAEKAIEKEDYISLDDWEPK